ncbi:MAG: prolipoprotein diacylglyceryl transferase [Bacteroidetes bacterium]|nr:prolipoprotein diacylglyceryl transferase [Bacteroidota bacterium]
MLSRLLSDTVCPILFKVGPLSVYSYGLMMGIGFLVANYAAVKEFKRKGLGADFANQVTILAGIFGIAGSKILSLIENWGDFMRDPIGMAFSPGGLTWYGGFILAAIVILWAAKRRNIRFASVADALAPALILGYGVARLGCHFSGDGDYGMPTTLPWGVDYSKGIVPPSAAFQGFPQIESKYPGGIVPNTVLLHPTPIYEFLACLLIFYVLWQMRKSVHAEGRLFMVYLILAGTERLLVEFIRLNPRLLFGLSEAQLISVVLIALGIAGLSYIHEKPDTVRI